MKKTKPKYYFPLDKVSLESMPKGNIKMVPQNSGRDRSSNRTVRF